jgi:hypothetical protein
MHTYVVHRPDMAASAADLDAALTQLRSFEEQPHTLPARWLHSYVLRDPDGRFGLACVFEADGVPSLEHHAARTGLPADEILPVAATVSVRAFAPTMVYLIRRRNFWPSTAELDRSAELSRRIGDEEMAREVSWLRSYAVRESDGTLGTVCLYQAVSPAALREHARRCAKPADEIVPVLGRVVYRDDSRPQPGLAAQKEASPSADRADMSMVTQRWIRKRSACAKDVR